MMTTTKKMMKIFAALLLVFVVSGEEESLPLAECPTEHVIGKYYNDGKQCVRDRDVFDRDISLVECPEGFNLDGKTCRKRTKVQRPFCAENYQRYGQTCHSNCPEGYNSKFGKCILPKDTFKSSYMKCPQGQHQVGARCCYAEECPDTQESRTRSSTPFLECNLENVPGKFYYTEGPKGGKCVRQADYIPRSYESVLVSDLSSTFACPDGQVFLRTPSPICQEPCPPFYKAKKGKCELRKCTLPVNQMDGIVMCPEGSYHVPSKQL